MDFAEHRIYSTFIAWAPSTFFNFRTGFHYGVVRSLALVLAGWLFRISESVQKTIWVVVHITCLCCQPSLRQLPQAVVAKCTRDGPMTEEETTILRYAPLPMAYVVGVVAGALAGRTALSVYSPCLRRLISVTWELLWDETHLCVLINGGTLLDFFRLFRWVALWLLLNLVPVFRVIADTVVCFFGTIASKFRTWMLSALVRTRIDAKGAPESTYRYPFTTHKRQIRLLKLQRSFLRIKATLITTYLDTAPAFEAISYTWGDSTTTHQLLIGGQAMPITRSAASVISHLASPWRTRLLWLDAVCVDQSSNPDKTTQVRIMPAIYSRASRVIVWLGDAPDAKIAFDFIHELRLWHTNGPKDEGDAFNSVRQAPDEHPKYCSLRRLLGNPYWSRVWIVQEVVLARVVHVNYGERWIDWSLLAGVVAALLNNEKGSLWENIALVEGLAVLPVHGLQKILAIATARRAYITKGLSLPGILGRFWKSKATLAVDRVFALQGISAATDGLAVEPDYSMSKLDVFEAATVHAFRSDKPFLLPSIACEARTASKPEHVNECWPSWVPDLEKFSDRHGLNALCENPNYKASGDESRIRLTYLKGNHAILLSGFRLDEIRVVAAQKPEFSYTVAEIDELAESASKAEQMTMSIITSGVARHDEALHLAERECSDRSFDGELRREAFWRTLFGNVSRTSYPAESEWGEHYEELIRLWKKILRSQSSDRDQAREAGFEAANLPEAVREELRNHEGYGSGSPEDLINTLEKLLVDIPVVEIRKYLTPALLADRARLIEEIITTVEPSRPAVDELRALVRDGKIDRPDMDLSSITASTWQELQKLAFSIMPTTKDYSAAHRRICLVMGFIYSVAGMSSLSDAKIAAFRAWVEASIILQKDLMQVHYLISYLASTFWPRQFAVTKTGLMALVPPETKPGDVVCVFQGAKTPHVLRKADGCDSGTDRWRLACEAYVHGYMEGRIVAEVKKRAEAFYLK